METENDTMAATGTVCELHGINQHAPIVKGDLIRFGLLPCAISEDATGNHVGVVQGRMQCAVAAYTASTHLFDFRIDTITGEQIDELYPWVDDEPCAGGSTASRLSIGTIHVANREASVSGDVASALRVGRFPGLVEVEHVSGRGMPGPLITNGSVVDDQLQLVIGSWSATDCGRTSDATARLHYAVSFFSGNAIKRISLGKGMACNTAFGLTPMTKCVVIECPVGDLDLGWIDAGTVNLGLLLAGAHTVDRMVAYHMHGADSTWPVANDPQGDVRAPIGSTITVPNVGVYSKRTNHADSGGWVLTTYGDAAPTGFRRQGDMHLKTATTATGSPEYVVLGWIVTAGGTMAPGNYEEIRTLTGG